MLSVALPLTFGFIHPSPLLRGTHPTYRPLRSPPPLATSDADNLSLSLNKKLRANNILRSWKLDGDGDGAVDKREFVEVMRRGGLKTTSEAKLERLFADIDSDSSGSLEPEEVCITAISSGSAPSPPTHKDIAQSLPSA